MIEVNRSATLVGFKHEKKEGDVGVSYRIFCPFDNAVKNIDRAGQTSQNLQMTMERNTLIGT